MTHTRIWSRDPSYPVRLIGTALVLLLMGSLTVSCTPQAVMTALHDDFTHTDAWRFGSDAVADVAQVDGRLQVHVIQPGQLAWASSEQTWENFHLGVDATQVSGPMDNEYGVLVRMNEDTQFYAFSISGDGYARAARYEDGTWHLLGADWSPSDAIQQGAATNRLEVIAQGATFEFRVNDQPVLQLEDATLQRGEVGLYAGAFGEGDVVIAFDNLDIEPLEP